MVLRLWETKWSMVWSRLWDVKDAGSGSMVGGRDFDKLSGIYEVVTDARCDFLGEMD